MYIEINDQFRFACMWLTNEEKNDQKLKEEIRILARELKTKRYKLVILESGDRDLLEQIKCLLSHNRNLAAKES